jgi:ferric-dicitrate binding protein FerR (iron transport regulator)
MSSFWSFFWPLVAAGLVIGAVAGTLGLRMPRAEAKAKMEGEALARHSRRRMWLSLAAGLIACVAVTGVWSGPMGAARVLTHRVERDARITLDNYEMLQVGS